MERAATFSEAKGAHAWRTELRLTLALAWPLILANLTMAAIGATDVVLMGWLGARPLASAALGINLTFAFGLICLGLVTASSPMMATAIGHKTQMVHEVRRTFRQSIWMVGTLIVPLWLILWNSEPIIRALGQEPDLARGAQSFLRGYMWSQLGFLLFQAMRNFVAALERPGWVLAISLAAIPLNALLGYALIFGKFGLPAWGLFGGGLASSIVWGLMAVGLAVVILTDRQFRRFHLFGRFWRADWPRFAQIWRLGLPIAVTLALEVTIFNAAVFLMGLISTAALAAHAIAIQIAALSFMIPLGLAQAVTVRVGLAHGRRDPAGIARAGWTSFALGEAFMLAMALVMLAMPHFLVHAFLDESDPRNAEVIALAVSFLAVAALFQIVDGAQAVGAGMLRGLHDTTVPMIYAALGYWVIGLGTGIWLAFGLGWGGIGIWIGLAIGLAVVAMLMVARWARRERLGLLHR